MAAGCGVGPIATRGTLSRAGRPVKQPGLPARPSCVPRAYILLQAAREMRLIGIFARAYPWRTAATIVCLLLAGIAEGVGISTALPLLALAARPEGAGRPDTPLERYVLEALDRLHLEPTGQVLLAAVVAGMTLKALLVLLAKAQVGYSVAHMITDLRLDLIRAVLGTRWEYYVRRPVGSFANAVATEARRASNAYLHATTILALLIQALAYTAVACLVSWRATAVALGGGVVIVGVLTRLVRMARKAGNRQTRLARELLARLTDVLQGVKGLKAMARTERVADLLERDTTGLRRALQREVLSKESLRALQEPLIIAFLATGAYVAVGRAGLDAPSAMVLGLLCARVVLGLAKVQREQQILVTDESAFFALRAMVREAEREREIRHGTLSPTLEKGIELVRVTFAYRPDHPVLQQASLWIPARSLTVLVGPSGAGKTTVVDLVVGLLEPQAGQVLVDGVPLRQLDVFRWRRMIGYVPQEALLLHDTVRVNVTLGEPELGDDDIERALRAAGAWEFVAALPEGLDTVVGERGLGVSGGQRQRIALARALVHQPRLLVLDEVTAGLDAVTERAIGETLRTLRGELTILAIAHHGVLPQVADQVARVEGGVIVPQRAPTRASGGSAV